MLRRRSGQGRQCNRLLFIQIMMIVLQCIKLSDKNNLFFYQQHSITLINEQTQLIHSTNFLLLVLHHVIYYFNLFFKQYLYQLILQQFLLLSLHGLCMTVFNHIFPTPPSLVMYFNIHISIFPFNSPLYKGPQGQVRTYFFWSSIF